MRFRRVLPWFLPALSLVLPVALQAAGEHHIPVKKIAVDKDGVYQVPFMVEESVSGFFAFPPELLVLGKVVHLDKPEPGSQGEEPAVGGRIQVERILRCPERLQKQAAAIRLLDTEGLNGLSVGDRVLVSMVPLAGRYRIKNHLGSNCRLGFLLPKEKDAGPFDTQAFLQLLESGHAWDPDSLSAQDWTLWTAVDKPGVLIVRQEMEQH